VNSDPGVVLKVAENRMGLRLSVLSREGRGVGGWLRRKHGRAKCPEEALREGITVWGAGGEGMVYILDQL
jgi:hypothetical protein